MTLFLFFSLSIIVSFLCSIWEAVLLSITPSYVSRQVREGGKLGVRLNEYKEDIDRPLSAILTLNTIAHTIGAIGVGAEASRVFGSHSFDLGFMSLSYEGIIAGLMTLAILLLSEIIPKTLGANNWAALAPFTVGSLNVLLWILSPFVWISQLITKKFKKDKDKSVLSRADFTALALAGAESGVLKTKESTTIENLLKLDKIYVRDIMTPRVVIVSAAEAETLGDFYEKNTPIQFSRIPSYQENPDHITGFILKDDLLIELVKGNTDKLIKDLRRDILTTNEDTNISTMLDILVKNRSHFSMVVDHFGGVVGLVSMEDIFETILGLEIVDEYDQVTDLQQFAREIWKKRAKNTGLISE